MRQLHHSLLSHKALLLAFLYCFFQFVAATHAETPGDKESWSIKILDEPVTPRNVSPVDLSFLNAFEKPAGKHGFLKKSGDSLRFEDGSSARFWGTNLTAHALFETDRDNTRLHARRLSQLGFNLVRFHHHDSYWVDPNIFGDSSQPDTHHLVPAMLERLDWWIKCLKDEGIYVWLDLHVQRHFKPSDGIDFFEEISRGGPSADVKGYNYVNLSIQSAMENFNRDYADHPNQFTGLRYKDDPAIVAMLLTNENDLTHHFASALLPDKKVPHHSSLYMTAADGFAAKYRLSKDRVWRSWLPGPSKLFLNDLEHRFNTRLITHLRSLGVKALLATTSSFGDSPLYSRPALTDGDIIAVNSYGGPGELKKNPVHEPNLVHRIAAVKTLGYPLVVPEWNVEPFPTDDRHTIPLYVAASGSLQGWDALMQYAYSQVALTKQGEVSNWNASNDPAMIAILPAAALMYRRHDIREANRTYVFAPSSDALFGKITSAANSIALRTAAEGSKLVIALPSVRELPWLKKGSISEGANVISNPQLSIIPLDSQESVSDTGELRRNWSTGVYTIDTPRTQAAMGSLGGKRIELGDVVIATETRNATISIQSLDGHPLNDSRSILISMGARAIPKNGNQLPFLSEPVIGQIDIRAPPGLKLYKRERSADTLQEISSSYDNGSYRIELTWDLDTYWLFLN